MEFNLRDRKSIVQTVQTVQAGMDKGTMSGQYVDDTNNTVQIPSACETNNHKGLDDTDDVDDIFFAPLTEKEE